MNNFSAWLSRLRYNFSTWARQLFVGRYGHDKLNLVLLSVGLVMSVLGVFVKNVLLNLIFTGGSMVLLVISMIRCFSRNTYQRYQENRRFLLLLDRFKDKTHRYFTCPKCHQTVRVPKGKGKIAITCPKCREKFVKNT